MSDTKKAFKLLQRDNNCSSSHESNQSCLWKKINNESQPEDYHSYCQELLTGNNKLFWGKKKKRRETNSHLSNPKEAWKRPAKKVEEKASWRNKRGSCVGDTSCLIIDPSIREAIETGPTARSLELPRTAYTKGGTKLESATSNQTVSRRV